MLSHKFPNPGLFLCISHLPVGIRLVYNALYFV